MDIPFAKPLSLILKDIQETFVKAGLKTPGFDARCLVAASLKRPVSQILPYALEHLTSEQQEQLSSFVERRLKHEPVARIIGEQEFWSLPFILNEETLVPRSDTEIVIELALSLVDTHLSGRQSKLKILDLGCGSGCILCALLKELPLSTGVGCDLSEKALEASYQNAFRNGLAERAQFVKSHWFDEVTGSFDVIVSNPPYIPDSCIDGLEDEVRLFDPHRALSGGDDGLRDYKEILSEAGLFLSSEGFLIFEIGMGQEEDVIRLAESCGYALFGQKEDYSGILRSLAFTQKV